MAWLSCHVSRSEFRPVKFRSLLYYQVVYIEFSIGLVTRQCDGEGIRSLFGHSHGICTSLLYLAPNADADADADADAVPLALGGDDDQSS